MSEPEFALFVASGAFVVLMGLAAAILLSKSKPYPPAMVPAAAIKRRRAMAEQMVDSASDARTVNNTMRHAYRVLSDEEKARMAAIKDKGAEMLALIESCGNSRELSLARTKTEEAVMWAVKHVTA